MSGTSASKVRLLLLEDGQGHSDRLRDILRDEGMDLILASRNVNDALQQVRNSSPDVILVALSEESLADTIERIDTVSGGSPIVALLTPEQAEQSRVVLLAGARALLPIDAERDELVDTIISVIERERRRREALAKQLGVEVDLGHLVAVHGAKGGVGATTVAVNLAVATQLATRKRVALVDANLYSGDVAASLNLMSRSSLADLTPNMTDLDQEFLERASVRHSSGLRAFLAPDDFVRAQVINGDHISRILKVMRQHYDYIIVDTCSLPDQVTTAAIEEANRILLIVTPELPALKNGARFLQLAGEFGYRDKIALVLNRAGSRGAIASREIEAHLHIPIAVSIGSDGRTVPSSVNAGEPAVVRRGRFSTGIWDVTALITGLAVRDLRKKRAQPNPSGSSTNVTVTASVPVRQLTPAREQAAFAVPEGSDAVSVQPRKRLWTRRRTGL